MNPNNNYNPNYQNPQNPYPRYQDQDIPHYLHNGPNQLNSQSQNYPNINQNQNNHWEPYPEENRNLRDNSLKNYDSSHKSIFPNENVSETPFDFKDQKIRSGFIRKVYFILSFQIFITFIFILVAFNSKPFRNFQNTNRWLLWVSVAGTVILMYALACYSAVARSVPLNYVLMILFTLFESYIVSFIASKTDRDTVLMAGALTLGIVIALTLYAVCTKTDFTGCGIILFVCVIALFIGGILAIFFRNKWLNLVLSVIGVIVFGIYLIMDTQLVIGKNSRMYSIDDYIMAAMNLYIDIIQIFLYILQILGAANGN